MIIQATPYGKLSTARLPKEYQEVEYIQSSGTQYINEEFRPSGENIRILTDYMYPSSPNGKTLFGAQTSATTFPITFYHTSATVGSFYVGSSHNIISYTVATGVRYLLDCHANDGVFTADLNGNKQTATYSGSLVKTLDLFMFTNNGQQGAQTIASRLYARQIWDNDEIARDYVPCYRKSDGVVGLYDLVNGVFYTNAGTGTFTKGADVGGSGSSGELLEFTYSGSFVDERDANGIGDVTLNTSGTLTVLSGKATVSVYILAGGGGGITSYDDYASVSGGGGGNQTVEVELAPGTYEIIIGTGGAGHTTMFGGLYAGNGGNTTAFGKTSTGGGGAETYSAFRPGSGGSPNGGNGSVGKFSSGGSPNGGASNGTTAAANNGGDGLVRITFS